MFSRALFIRNTVQWKYKQETCSFGIILIQFHFPFQASGNDGTDVQSESCALFEFIQLAEPVENAICLVCRNPRTSICNGEGYLSRILRKRAMKVNLAPFRVFLRIGQEIDKYLLQAFFVRYKQLVIRHIGSEIRLHFFRITMHNGNHCYLA